MATDVGSPEASSYSSNLVGKALNQASNGLVNHRIFDIRRESVDNSIFDDIKSGIAAPDGEEKTLPTLLLYDAIGLKLFEKITYLDEYYLTNAEIQVLENFADHIAARVPSNSLMIELGSGYE